MKFNEVFRVWVHLNFWVDGTKWNKNDFGVGRFSRGTGFEQVFVRLKGRFGLTSQK